MYSDRKNVNIPYVMSCVNVLSVKMENYNNNKILTNSVTFPNFLLFHFK